MLIKSHLIIQYFDIRKAYLTEATISQAFRKLNYLFQVRETQDSQVYTGLWKVMPALRLSCAEFISWLQTFQMCFSLLKY